MRIAISCSVKSVEASSVLILSISAAEKYRPCDLRIPYAPSVAFHGIEVKSAFESTQAAILTDRNNALRNQRMLPATPVLSEKMCIRFDHLCELHLSD